MHLHRLYLGMVEYDTVILQFSQYCEKTGWIYIQVSADVAQAILPDKKKPVRVRGWLDNFQIAGKSLLPMGEGNFILPLKQEIRKGIRKSTGAMLKVRLEHDPDFKIEMPADLQECFDDEPEAFKYFSGLTKSHQGYFIKWINEAKTEATRANRMAATLNATIRQMDYGKMLRGQKKLKEGNEQ